MEINTIKEETDFAHTPNISRSKWTAPKVYLIKDDVEVKGKIQALPGEGLTSGGRPFAPS